MPWPACIIFNEALHLLKLIAGQVGLTCHITVGAAVVNSAWLYRFRRIYHVQTHAAATTNGITILSFSMHKINQCHYTGVDIITLTVLYFCVIYLSFYSSGFPDSDFIAFHWYFAGHGGCQWRNELYIPDNRVHVAHMGPTWVMSAPGRPNVGPMNLAIRDGTEIVLALWYATSARHHQ